MNVTVAQLFQDYLTIDAVLVGNKTNTAGIYVLAPALVGSKAGSISEPTKKGTCVWFEAGRCKIHDVKPLECQAVDHATAPQDADLVRVGILKKWKANKKFVQDLYGKKLKLPTVLKQRYREAHAAKAAERGHS